MSFDIIVKYIKSFSGIYLAFKHDAITPQTLVDDSLILPKMFLETDYFGNLRTVRQFYAAGLEYILDYWAYLSALYIRLIIRVFIYLCNRITKACARQFSSAFTLTTLCLRYAITESGLPLLVIACLPKPTGILTECTVTTNVSRALNLEFDWETFSNTLHITLRITDLSV